MCGHEKVHFIRNHCPQALATHTAVSTDWALKLSRILIGDLFHVFKLFPSAKLSSQWHLINKRAQPFSGDETNQTARTYLANKTLGGTWALLEEFFGEAKHTSPTNLQLPQ